MHAVAAQQVAVMNPRGLRAVVHPQYVLCPDCPRKRMRCAWGAQGVIARQQRELLVAQSVNPGIPDMEHMGPPAAQD